MWLSLQYQSLAYGFARTGAVVRECSRQMISARAKHLLVSSNLFLEISVKKIKKYLHDSFPTYY